MEVLRAGLLTQETILRTLVDNIDRRFQAFEGLFDEIANRLDALALGANRDMNDDRRRPRDDFSQGQPINRLVPARHRRQPIYSGDSEEDGEFLCGNHQPVRGEGRYTRYHDRDGGDFILKVDIPYFNGNLNIEEFIDWIVDIDKFFDYMRVSEEKMIKLVACRLKGGASVWWERLQNRRIREGKHRVRTLFRMKQLLKKDFLPLDYEQIFFQEYQRCHQGMRSVHEYTAEFMRLAKRNYLKESEGQQAVRYLEGLKPQICDMIGVQVVRDLHEAKSMALKVEFKMQDRRRVESPRINYRSDTSIVPVDKRLTVQELQPLKDCFREEKAARKQKVVDNRETLKATNLYTWPAPVKCFKCNLPFH